MLKLEMQGTLVRNLIIFCAVVIIICCFLPIAKTGFNINGKNDFISRAINELVEDELYKDVANQKYTLTLHEYYVDEISQ